MTRVNTIHVRHWQWLERRVFRHSQVWHDDRDVFFQGPYLCCPFKTICNGDMGQLPPTSMPTDLWSIQLQEEQIGHYFPVSVVCELSVCDSIECLTNISHLEICHWVNYFWSGKFAACTIHNQKIINIMIDPLKDAPTCRCTFFMLRQMPWYARLQALISILVTS